MYDHAWENEKPVSELGITVPKWIDQDIRANQIAAIVQRDANGIAGIYSGAYMPAQTYYDAMQTMAKWGDDVADYIDIFTYPGRMDLTSFKDQSWSGLCIHVLSKAVHMWAVLVVDEVEIASRSMINLRRY
tara:strand:+ start:639 stop:1031 length:393 start_codon:yes stop_codon:yes gene_type:complete